MKLLLLSLLLLTASCNNKNAAPPEMPKDFDYGKIENNTYSNTFFDFSMKFPSDWKVQSKKEMEELVEVGKDAIDNGDPAVKRAIKASEITTAYLFTAFKYEVGAEVDFNPSLMVLAENVSQAKGVETGKDYLEQVRQLMNRTSSQIVFENEYEKRSISGKEFYILHGQMKGGDSAVDQLYCATVIHGFAVSVILSFLGEEQEDEMVAVFEGIKFGE